LDVVPARPKLLIIGAGHVGLAVAELAARCGFLVSVADDREALVSKERFPMASALFCEQELEKALNKACIDFNTAVVVATHADDERALRWMVGKPRSYLGMLGSRRKVDILLKKLKDQGTPESELVSIRAPIGLDIGSETPEEIAISIIAEIMADTRKASCQHLSSWR
jgi:xanthine dehydrogenase accessory factor